MVDEGEYQRSSFILIYHCLALKVPEAARGAGVGGLLAKAALDWAAGRKNLKEIGGDQADSDGVHGGGKGHQQQHVVLSCTFLKRWLP